MCDDDDSSDVDDGDLCQHQLDMFGEFMLFFLLEFIVSLFDAVVQSDFSTWFRLSRASVTTILVHTFSDTC